MGGTTTITSTYGWCSLRPQCLRFMNKPVVFLIAVSVASFFQGAIINGFVNVSLTSIETRFGVGSKQVGFIPSSYDLAGILCVIPLGYFGGRMSQTRILGSCLLLSCVGAVIMFLPHLFTMNKPSPMDALKDGSGTNAGFCGNSIEVESSPSLGGWVTLFYLGMFVMGFGFGPLWTNTFDYMDKNLSHSSFPIYSAVFTLSGIIGPGFGYIFGGLLLSLPFDDVFKTSEAYSSMSDSEYEALTENTNFIGAYWVGFVFSAVGLFLISIPVGGFPYEFPESENIRHKKVNEALGATSLNEESKLTTVASWKDFKAGILYVIKNPIVICIAFAGAMEGFFLASMSSFGPKLLEVLFNFTSSEAALTIGYILIPSATIALILGGVLPKVCSFTNRHLLLFCFLTSVTTFLSTFGFFINCGQADFIKPSDQVTYQGVTCDISSCDCDRSNFKPFCLDKKTLIFSPCYYGCSDEVLTNCSCYNSTINSELTSGSCEISEFCSPSNFYVMLFFLTVGCFTVFFNLPAAEAALDRSVVPKFRSLAFGFDVFIMRFFGTVPATLVVGAMFDGKCTLWQVNSNGDKGACLRYDDSVASGFTAICIATTGLMSLLFLAAFLFEKFKREKFIPCEIGTKHHGNKFPGANSTSDKPIDAVDKNDNNNSQNYRPEPNMNRDYTQKQSVLLQVNTSL